MQISEISFRFRNHKPVLPAVVARKKGGRVSVVDRQKKAKTRQNKKKKKNVDQERSFRQFRQHDVTPHFLFGPCSPRHAGRLDAVGQCVRQCARASPSPRREKGGAARRRDAASAWFCFFFSSYHSSETRLLPLLHPQVLYSHSAAFPHSPIDRPTDRLLCTTLDAKPKRALEPPPSPLPVGPEMRKYESRMIADYSIVPMSLINDPCEHPPLFACLAQSVPGLSLAQDVSFLPRPVRCCCRCWSNPC